MQYWKQAAKQQQHNNDCPNSFYYNITVQPVCSHVNTSSRLMTISFPWQLIDIIMFLWKASSPLRDCSTISWKQDWSGTGDASRLCLSLPSKSTILLWVSASLQMCVHALPRLPAKITIKLLVESSVLEIGRDFWGLVEAVVPLHLRTLEGPDASSQKQQNWKKSYHFSTI